MTVRNPNWTERDDITVADLRGRGVTHRLIGVRLGRTEDAVKRRIRWIRLSAERRAEIGRTKTRSRTKPTAAEICA